MKIREFELAKEMARKSNMSKRHGAVLMSGGKICGTGYNHMWIDKVNLKCFKTMRIASIHAEIDCIQSCRSFYKEANRKKYTMIIVRMRRDDEKLMCSKPCSMCLDILKKFRVKKVYYTNDDGNIENIRIGKLITDFISRGILTIRKCHNSNYKVTIIDGVKELKE